jgi:hypothetical protein
VKGDDEWREIQRPPRDGKRLGVITINSRPALASELRSTP